MFKIYQLKNKLSENCVKLKLILRKHKGIFLRKDKSHIHEFIANDWAISVSQLSFCRHSFRVILVNPRVILWSYYCSRPISPWAAQLGASPAAHPARWAPSPRWRRTGASCAARRGCGTPGQRTGSPPRCCHRPACPRPPATSSSAPPHAPPLQTPPGKKADS